MGGGLLLSCRGYLEQVNRAMREFAKYSRVAMASYYKTNQDYYGRYLGIWSVVPHRSSLKIDQRWILQLGPELRAMRPEAQTPGTIAQAASRAEAAAATLTMAGSIQQRGRLQLRESAASAERRTTGRGHPEGGAVPYVNSSSYYSATLGDARQAQKRTGFAAPRTPAMPTAPVPGLIVREGGTVTYTPPPPPPLSQAIEDSSEQPLPPPPPPRSGSPLRLVPRRTQSEPRAALTLTARLAARTALAETRGTDTAGQRSGSGILENVSVVLSNSLDNSVSADVVLADGSRHHVVLPQSGGDPIQGDPWENYRTNRLLSPARPPRAKGREGASRSQAPARRREMTSRERSRERKKKKPVPNAEPTSDGSHPWGTSARGPDMWRYKLKVDDTVYEANLSEDEKEYTEHIPHHPWYAAEGATELVAKLKADFGFRSDVTMAETGFITQSIQFYNSSKYLPNVGTVGAVVPAALATSGQADELRVNLGALSSSTDGMQLHEQMQRRAHLEARQVIWDKDALDHAQEFIKTAQH